MIDPQLEGKVALITGANHGIGAATARAFAAQGARVFITYFRSECHYSEDELNNAIKDGVGGDVLYRALQQQSPDHIVQEICSQGKSAFEFEISLADPQNIPVLFDLCEKEMGPVDILVNNHTVCLLETFDPEAVSDEGRGIRLPSAESIDAHFAVNTRAVALMMSEYLSRYLNRGAKWGRSINLSTDAADCHPINVSYAASKHAIESYSRSAACEMGKNGITVNIVAPGPTQTGYITPEAEAATIKDIPLGRLGKAEDIADAIVFLASEQAHWITGQLLYVGGGKTMHQ